MGERGAFRTQRLDAENLQILAKALLGKRAATTSSNNAMAK